ncbi:hypothetical protein BGX28_005169 [Mortierella sp. GBA30]|nr:hypothetical protein BGX28_005169 [Mortierella sp. GBA30]
MPQLLESTRNYLKSSTKIGRRLSSYKEDSSASEASLHDLVPSTLEAVKPQQRRHPSTHKRLSALFTLEGRNRNSVSSEDRTVPTAAVNNILSRKIVPEETQEQQQQPHQEVQPEQQQQQSIDGNNRKKRKNSSRTSTQSQLYQPTPPPQQRSSRLYESSEHSAPTILKKDLEAVPRGRSPTFSNARTARTTASSSAASSYDTRPSDYPSMKHYQAHLFRRTLLEESIMHSLKLGYATSSEASTPRSSTTTDRSLTDRPRTSRSLKSGSRAGGSSSCMSDEQQAAMLASALSKDLPPRPTPKKTDSTTSMEIIVDRSMAKSSSNKRSVKDEKRISNSPYQLLLNPSTTNITQSYASFTLELPEHHASHVMSASVVPNLFQIKAHGGPRGRKVPSPMGKIVNAGQSGPSPRVLTGKAMAEQEALKENMDPRYTPQVLVAAV